MQSEKNEENSSITISHSPRMFPTVTETVTELFKEFVARQYSFDDETNTLTLTNPKIESALPHIL